MISTDLLPHTPFTGGLGIMRDVFVTLLRSFDVG